MDLAAELLRRALAAVGLPQSLRARSEAALAAGDDTDAQVQRLIERHGAELAALAARLRSGGLTKQQFIDQATAQLQALVLRTGRMGANREGDPLAFSQQHAEAIVSARLDYLDDTAATVEDADTSDKMSAYRAGRWSGLGWMGYQVGRRAAHVDEDAGKCWWELDDSVKEHCDGCLDLAANSPYPVDDPPADPGDGSTDCADFCQCDWRFS